MSDKLKSTVAFTSNLQVVHTEKIIDDRDFLLSVQDTVGLEWMRKRNIRMSRIQAIQYKRVAMHCVYADKGDYPFGTVLGKYGSKKVVCKCHKISCKNFSQCRPNFDPAELNGIRENDDQIIEVDNARRLLDYQNKIRESYDVDTEAASHLYENFTDDETENEAAADSGQTEEKVASDKPAPILSVQQETETAPEKADTDIAQEESASNITTEESKIDTETKEPAANISLKESEDASFESFSVVEQDIIIRSDPEERIIVNAGPGTGKTWTLIEKVKYMLSEEVDPENILILSFSRAAVNVIRNRLKDAADSGDIPMTWHLVDTRTFDSFATYMLVWVAENMPELLPRKYSLESQNYDERIATAVSVLKSEQDLLSEYQHIIVDEVQDLVGVRAEMVLALLKSLPDTCGFTLLGDSCQALYDYISDVDKSVISSTEFYKQLFHEFGNAAFYTLDKNFRQNDDFGSLAIPYREAILSGSAADRSREATVLYSQIDESGIDLKHFTIEDAKKYLRYGTLGILTRTNGQALQISTWLRNEGVEHQLKKKSGAQNMSGWIYDISVQTETDVLGKEEFMTIFQRSYPENADVWREFWNALAYTQKDTSENYYEIENLLRGLLQNPRNPLLFKDALDNTLSEITVSTIHRAKGCEFDSVLVVEDVISQMSQGKQDSELEHKVCYVAVTRPRKKLEQVKLKKQFIYIMKDESRRCFMRGGRYNRLYLSHFEVGEPGDLDERSFALSEEIQENIRKKATPGLRLKLLKCPEISEYGYYAYRVVLEDNENIILGYTSKRFYQCMEIAIRRVYNSNRPIKYKNFPNQFDDIYVDELTTCISYDGSNLAGAKQFGGMYIWKGISISGFAHMIKDNY